MNIDKNLSENDMDLDDEARYNFTYLLLNLFKMMVSHLGGPMRKTFRAGLHYSGEGLRSVKNAWPRHGYMRQMVDVSEKN